MLDNEELATPNLVVSTMTFCDVLRDVVLQYNGADLLTNIDRFVFKY